ncbi:MAG: DUF1566 domain-containing protein [bacterium]|nr:DUF1566 domain-containing protein [bacterium]
MKKNCLLWLLWWAFGLPALWAAPYTGHGDQTVTDQATGLMWDQRETSTRTWQAALAYCEGLDHAGHTDWRLPNRNELESLVDDAKTSSPVIDTTAFPNAVSYYYWASTSHALNTSNALSVLFNSGYVNHLNKTSNRYVRCVR